MKALLKSIKFLFFAICFISTFIDSRSSSAMDLMDDPLKKQKGKLEVGGQDREDSPLLGVTPTNSSPSLQFRRTAAELSQRPGSDTPPTASRTELATNDHRQVLDEDSSSDSFGDGSRPLLLAMNDDSGRSSSS
ncbi:MAG: hypothetical protein K2X39_05745, partial [Silvanigrellaceae bacterium]|nr:hypothetical protein [Silvanigrellaceae bacterium]